MISKKIRPVCVNNDTFIVHLNMNTEGWDHMWTKIGDD